jgi:hypothetical protein
VKDAKLDVWSAVLASSLFWMAPVVTAASLVETSGVNIEPFGWVLILWGLRHHPLPLGLCLATGFLNREFTIYAAPPLVLAQIVEARGISREVIRGWIVTAIGFLVVFNLVLLLKPLADFYGPGSAGMPLPAGGRDSVSLLMARINFDPAVTLSQLRLLVTEYFPLLVGLPPFRPGHIAIQTNLIVGWPLLQPVMAVGTAAAVALLVGDLLRRGPPSDRAWLFPTYLIIVGVIAGVAYPMTRQLSLATLRYGLLLMYLPIGLAALLLHRERAAAVRWLGATGVVILGTCAAIDHARVLASAWREPPRGDMRMIADRLKARGATVARADYWRAYSVTFLSGETIKVASTDFVRIVEYQRLANNLQAAGRGRAGLVTIERTACAGGEEVAGWYLCQAP